ncbi:hypothetical protein BFJ66_g6256 [Fusarium oxysporum f. sp. cepae]|nr:hypothetical protein FOMA001_g975 [Fusarium oxysporum f. sp. matthiolae]RKK48748.1 hypothetical protein BFJ67_g7220 [Fusarium oxysporum f. sp. cepae]RKK51021.1 hypothetical protein BFJ66_g6256 [Fusarium oxysporum f. sp. cepae]RKK95586.1 hypothetical protein BFJ71_g8340 [Fusarium oxysporum]
MYWTWIGLIGELEKEDKRQWGDGFLAARLEACHTVRSHVDMES